MTVRLVIYRKGGKRDDMVAAVSALRSWWMQHGAHGVALSQEIAGPAAGQWVIVIWWHDWEAYGRGMAAAVADDAFLAILAKVDAVGELTSRRLLSSIDL